VKILIVHPGPEWSVADLYAGWAEALAAAGHHVIGYPTHHKLAFYDGSFLQYDNTGPGSHKFRKALTVEQAINCAVDGLFSALYRHHPDVLFIVSGFLIPTELLDLARFRGTKVIVLHTESPYEDDRQVEQAAHADLNLVNDPTNLHRFQWISPTVYMPHAYRPRVHKPGRAVAAVRSDFAFVGTGFESRIAFLEAMDLDGVDVLLAGNWQRLGKKSPLRKYVAHDMNECLDNDETAKVYRSAKVGINYYRRQDGEPSDGWSMGPREVEQAACGLFFLRDSRPEGDELLPMLPTFGSPAEASDQLRYYLAHPRLRARAARQAREAIADRTFDRNVQVLTEALGKDQ
jgi:hypothetical protein